MRDDIYFFHQTPEELAKQLIQYVTLEPNDIVFEPFRGEGAFYNNFPNFCTKLYAEIENEIDYRDVKEHYDWVITNPPFKIDNKNCFYKLLEYFTTNSTKGIALLCNDYCLGTLTPKRILDLNNKGWFVQNIVVTQVKKWRGRYYFIILTKEKCNFFQYIIGNF